MSTKIDKVTKITNHIKLLIRELELKEDKQRDEEIKLKQLRNIIYPSKDSSI